MGWGFTFAAGPPCSDRYADILKEGPTQIVARTQCQANSQLLGKDCQRDKGKVEVLKRELNTQE